MFEFARNAERRRGWRVATALLGMTYLGVWLAFGVVCYVLYNAFGMPWPGSQVWRSTAIAGDCSASTIPAIWRESANLIRLPTFYTVV